MFNYPLPPAPHTFTQRHCKVHGVQNAERHFISQKKCQSSKRPSSEASGLIPSSASLGSQVRAASTQPVPTRISAASCYSAFKTLMCTAMKQWAHTTCRVCPGDAGATTWASPAHGAHLPAESLGMVGLQLVSSFLCFSVILYCLPTRYMLTKENSNKHLSAHIWLGLGNLCLFQLNVR